MCNPKYIKNEIRQKKTVFLKWESTITKKEQDIKWNFKIYGFYISCG